MRSICLFFTLVALGGCDKQPAGGPANGAAPSVPVTATTVGTRDFLDETIAIGNLKSAESVDISTNVTERIASLHFEDGQFVEKGAVLAKLAAREEEAMLAMANSEMEEEKREIERLKRLAGKNAVSEVTLAERLTKGEMAAANINRTEAMLEDRRITAPFAGVVGLRQLSPGALVEPGDLITTLDQIDTMKLDFTVPEIFLDSLKTGTALTARSGADPNDAFSATIATVGSRVDPVTRSLSVRAIIPNEDRRLKPGMLMTVQLKRNERNSPAIPERAVVSSGQRKSVYLIQDDSTVVLTPVEIGARVPGYAEIVSGLKKGDRIVTDGVLSLKDGAKVTVAGEFEGPAEAFDPTESDS